MNLALRRVTTVAGAAVVALAATVVPATAATPPPRISSVTFAGPNGDTFVASPTITIKGNGFGNAAPPGTAANSCDPDFTDNGQVFADKLYFSVNGGIGAGFSSPAGANCIGIQIVSWQPQKVVIKFGADTYGEFDNYWIRNGDGYAISIKKAIWGGSVSGLT